ncbi:ankyrin repeat-containing domain protein [Cladorrhinum sp. PSN259]|nr:ankyrin repeat-containing domain protein [Cladorrhinum sp. PSN259]
MRLIDTRTLQLVSFVGDDVPLYGILSHRWGPEEVSLQDMIQNNAEGKAGYAKIRNVCSVAASHGLDYAWVDTCCIDKTSSAELSEAINSMYRWYREAAVCYTFLNDVEPNQSAPKDAPVAEQYPGFAQTCWLTRGWTLQELIAPYHVIFLDSAWDKIGTKSDPDLRHILSEITGIPGPILAAESPVETASIAQRFSWASSRETTRPEDMAYCLMGLFNVNMPMLYGEGGKKAFIRLQEEIIKFSDDHTVFAWSDWQFTISNGGILATSPRDFAWCRDLVPWDLSDAPRVLTGVISTSNKGIHLKLNLILPAKEDSEKFHTAILPCRRANKPEILVGLLLDAKSFSEQYFTRVGFYEVDYLTMGDLRESKGGLRDICIQRAQQTYRDPPTIFRALRSDNMRLLRVLLETGASLESQNEDCHTPLLLAARFGHYAATELLVSSGAQIEGTVARGMLTPLMWAAQGGHDSIVKILITKGANIEAVDHDFQTALSLAAMENQIEAARVLICAGANLNTKDRFRFTPLMFAAARGHAEMLKLLIEHGANIDARDNSRRTALEIAMYKGHGSIAKMLRGA